MALVRWDPFRNMATLQDRINRLFDDAFPRAAGPDDEVERCAWRPLVDIFDSETGITIMADLPGVDKQNVSVEVKENVLTLRGERIAETQVDEDHYYRRERTCGTFHRSFTLRAAVAPDSISASFKNGVLKIDIPKPQEEKPRQVEVNIE